MISSLVRAYRSPSDVSGFTAHQTEAQSSSLGDDVAQASDIEMLDKTLTATNGLETPLMHNLEGFSK